MTLWPRLRAEYRDAGVLPLQVHGFAGRRSASTHCHQKRAACYCAAKVSTPQKDSAIARTQAIGLLAMLQEVQSTVPSQKSLVQRRRGTYCHGVRNRVCSHN